MLARLQTPLGGLLLAAATGALGEVGPLQLVATTHAVTVVVASAQLPGHPAHRRPDHRARGRGRRARRHTCCTPAPRRDEDGALVVGAAAGCCPSSALGDEPGPGPRARLRRVDRIELDGSHHRTDIALAAERGEITGC